MKWRRELNCQWLAELAVPAPPAFPHCAFRTPRSPALSSPALAGRPGGGRRALCCHRACGSSIRCWTADGRRQGSPQKQPCTNIATRRLANTMSGVPDRRLSCRRKRNPWACKKRRTAISAPVSCERTARMVRLRCGDVWLMGGVRFAGWGRFPPPARFRCSGSQRFARRHGVPAG